MFEHIPQGCGPNKLEYNTDSNALSTQSPLRLSGWFISHAKRLRDLNLEAGPGRSEPDYGWENELENP